MYITAASKVLGNSAIQNEDCWCICVKLYCGHALREQVSHVVDGIWCISRRVKPRIIKTVASMFIYEAGNMVPENRELSVHLCMQ